MLPSITSSASFREHPKARNGEDEDNKRTDFNVASDPLDQDADLDFS